MTPDKGVNLNQAMWEAKNLRAKYEEVTAP
jgi:hypothetical protein